MIQEKGVYARSLAKKAKPTHFLNSFIDFNVSVPFVIILSNGDIADKIKYLPVLTWIPSDCENFFGALRRQLLTRWRRQKAFWQ